jgi:hypothetical protein
MQTEQYRGPITNRGLTSTLNQRDGYPTLGNIDLLGLTLLELKGKKILDVGMGGGRTLKHALELGLDCHGLDILPLIDTESLDSPKRNTVLEQQFAYEETRSLYPSRVKAVNFCTTTIPYNYDEFDIVFSAVALPDYSRTTQEAELAILNMICLAKEKVAFHCGWNPGINYLGNVVLGTTPGLFQFEMKKFLDHLIKIAGIQYDIILPDGSDSNPLTTNLHINTQGKNRVELQKIYESHLGDPIPKLSSSHPPLVTV